MSLTFATDKQANQWSRVDARVRSMVWEAVYLAQRFNYSVVVTSLIREDGIHALKGAADIDFVPKNDSTTLAYNQFGQMAARYINKTYKYGRGWLGKVKPAALWHGGSDRNKTKGWHLHIQAPAGRPMRLTA